MAAGLLIAFVSIVVPLTFRATRIWQEARSYRLAVGELNNRLEEWTVMNDQERQQAMSNWKASPGVAHALPDVRLTGETIVDTDGKRIKLSLNWRRSVDAPPLVMMGWVHPEGE